MRARFVPSLTSSLTSLTSLASLASLAAELLGSLVAPPRCAACDAPARLLAVFCGPCAARVQRADGAGGTDGTQGTDGASLAAFEYGGPVAEAIVRLKYGGRPDLARPLADLLWRALRPHGARLRGVAVVPVPLHPSRLAERGYNQSALIAARLARRLEATFLPLALARVRHTPAQATLDRAARMANLAGAFRARQPERVRGARVLVVDDVRTTGATVDACTRSLLQAGAAWVAHAVVARAQPGL